MFVPVQTSAPAVAIISTADAKAHLNVDTSDDDTLIDSYVAAATERLDGRGGILGRCLITQSWRQDYTAWDDKMRLPFPDVQSVSSVQYYDSTNTLVTVNSSVYELIEDAGGSYVFFKDAFTEPTLYDDRSVRVQITFTAGYGAAATNIPQPIIHAALLMVGDWYEHRSVAITGAMTNAVPMAAAVSALLAPYKRIGP